MTNQTPGMFISSPAAETGLEDTSSIESDISTLAKTYISPIDNLRSISRPGVANTGTTTASSSSNIKIAKADFSNIQVNNFSPMESRTHTFYRMLGFPVVGSDGSFYNPGFDPGAAQTFDKHQAINAKISVPLQTIMGVRETNKDELKQIFANQDIGASTYALLLTYPLPFKVLADGVGPLDVDPQIFTVNYRATAAQAFANANPLITDSINAIASTFFSQRHILRPFIVDPRLDNTVMPDSKKVCVPFLPDKKSTQITKGVYLQRPGIEAIIRQRLSDQSLDTAFLNDVKNIIANQSSPGVLTSSLDRGTLTDTIAALSASNQISSSSTDVFTNFSTTQVSTVSMLILTIKQVIKQLNNAILTVLKAQQLINWVPVPSQDGPETGSVGASLSRAGTNSNSLIDNQIIVLTINKYAAQSQNIDMGDIGNFASPFAGSSGASSIKSYDDQLQELKQKRDGIAQDAFKAMGIIEIIMGEISGLGLINILAIYTALWAIDTDVLIGFLDDDAFSRLYENNTVFQGVPEVSARNHGVTKSMIDVLTAFETEVSNILSFADGLLVQQLISPLGASGGSVA